MSVVLQNKSAQPQADNNYLRYNGKTKPQKASRLDYTQNNWRDTESADLYDFWEAKRELSLWQAIERLRRAVERAPDRPLPKQEQLEAHFNQSLSDYTAVWSHEIRTILDQIKVKAAVLDNCMILPDEGVSFETLKHETAHLLQTIRTAQTPIDSRLPDDNQDTVDAAEAEAEQAETNEQTIEAERPEGTMLFRAAQAQQDDENADWEAAQDYRNQRRMEQTRQDNGSPSTTEQSGATTNTTGANDNGPSIATSDTNETQADNAVSDVPQLEPPSIESEMPDLGEAVAEAEADITASVTALDEAQTPEDYTAAFKNAPPSVKAERYDGYQIRLDELAAAETESFNATLPEPEANLSGNDETLPPTDPVTAPTTTVESLEDTAPSPTPDPEIAPTQEAVPYNANRNAADAIRSNSETASADEIAAAIAGFVTEDNEIETSAGAPPSVPLEGESDPARMSDQNAVATDEAATRRDEAMTGVLEGPGPEQVQLREMREAVPLTIEETALSSTAIEPVGGAEEFGEHALDAETQAIFDQAHGENMQASLEGAQAEASAMAEERDTRREESVSQAQTELANAEETANTEQQTHVQDAREAIQSERQSTLEAQNQAVVDLDNDIASENSRVRGEVDARVQEDEATVSRNFNEAEEEATARVTQGEAEAEAEREAADEEAENASWWDRAVNWVKEQLSRLTEAIGAIFDAVREGVTFILDQAKEAAFALIDAAANFVKDAITAYGEFLKASVNLLVGSVFPEFAAQLNRVIDAGVALAHQAVDAVAENLKAAVNSIVEGLNAAINAVLSFVEGALNTIVAVVSAALSGDWGEVARLILEPVLRALGIEPADFYSYIGNVMSTIGNIIANPLDFLGNLFGAIVEGFRKFGNNFFDHLISGIVGWLTGAFAGDIQMPERFDFWGILDIARQILGLTVDMMRRVAVRILGEAAVERIEFFIGYAVELITGGWGAFFEKIQQDLSGLADTVIGEITTFLTERLIKAGIVWLASLINPAGALLKIIMMIWDFIMWLKDNFMRIVQVVRTVVDGMIQIANGNIEPAAQAIERVLAGLLPPTIDIIARLIGLGNVAGRVKDIIGGIRQKIEDAIVRLIQRVLARFTGRRGGSDNSDAPDADGEIMTPLSISGGGETHTLYVNEQGDDVVPMMRSTPTAIRDWLNTLKTSEGVERQLRAGSMDDADINESKVTEVQNNIRSDVDAALDVENRVDQESEQADDALDNNSPNAQSEAAQVDAAAALLKPIMERILDALGLTGGNSFKDTFATEINGCRDFVKTSLNGAINDRINADTAKQIIYTQMSWAEVIAHLGSDTDVLTGALKRPLHSGGVFRGPETADFRQALYDKAEELSAASPTLTDVKDTDLQDEGLFLRPMLLPEVQDTASVQILVKHALSPASRAHSECADELTEQITAALTPNSTQEDYEFKLTVNAEAFKEDGIFSRRETFTSLQLKHYAIQPESGVPTGAYTEHPLVWFLTESEDSTRWQKNVTYTANMLRAAHKGQHEWILSSKVNEAIQATAANLETTHGTDEVEGFTNFIEFQHKVRTPTNQLIFSPEYVSGIERDLYVHLLTHEHITRINSEGQLQPEEYEEIKKTTAPAIQAHAGGLNMVQLNEDNTLNTKVASQTSSPRWHADLQEATGNALSNAGSLDYGDINALGDSILSFFVGTIYNPASDSSEVARGGGFGEYRFSGGGGETHSFDEIRYEAWGRYHEAYNNLREKIEEVIGN